MTTRRSFLLLAGTSIALGAAGCRDTATPPAAATAPDVLIAETGQGLVRLTPQGVQAYGPASVLSNGGTRLAVVREKVLSQIVTGTGETTRTAALPDGWLPRAVSPDGRACALSRTPASVVPRGRERTPLLVVVDGRQREFDLPGVIEPDAFSSDASALFVLDWQPAGNPDHYRVRVLDLATGRMEPLNTRAKTAVPAGAEEQMRGEGRQAVPAGNLLLTLYTHQPGHQHTRDLLSGRPGNAHAFVHVLHLTDRWAYCLDLPHPFGEGPPAAHALAADAEGLVVLDSTSGQLAYADLETLTIQRTGPARVPAGTAAALALTADRRVLAGAKDQVSVLDRGSGTVTGGWHVPDPLLGIGLSRDGSRVYAGTTGAVHWLDARTGEALGRVPVDGLTGLRHVG
ncbi:hypothetical protein BJY16_008337 [Actinoplanes octamycinicus]|uniref:Lipoprotein n=1 Tax=Actinoplanes octamycinicus TaxID=135948 RepID=A0A7W7H6M6_9ACTN|nr:hypothetical protein [Actinoplanes octamycinicus]MBB4744878.1 hypothetical protein [Actinoplanes octamycinicus]GIE55464.1 hypothetical protein Aoc01nite_08660 [Actinoplanes octamycinicus]